MPNNVYIKKYIASYNTFIYLLLVRHYTKIIT